MELKYISADKELNHSFHARRESIPYLENNWHYHEEFELIFIMRGEGIRILGDSLSEFRIGKACQMLISGDQSMTEICFNSGFNSLTTFNRVFKDLKKMTPGACKERYRPLAG